MMIPVDVGDSAVVRENDISTLMGFWIDHYNSSLWYFGVTYILHQQLFNVLSPIFTEKSEWVW